MRNAFINAEHLKESERIKLGAFYTPEKIVSKVYELVEEYLNNSKVVVLDPAGGFGAFIWKFQNYDYRIGEIDPLAVKYLKETFDSDRVFHTNALVDVKRSKYRIPEDAFLIVVGNPPYNDWTSLYKKGMKGNFKMDSEVFDRDIGMAFLKAMNKLRADVICILHPMSYLIKKANFKRLETFFKFYTLLKAFIFPSFFFKWTSRSVGFPVLIALYIRDQKGFNWESLIKFPFTFLHNGATFKLIEIETTDGFINKYPRRELSPIGLYFHTFRDINSILRNRDFLTKPTDLTIPLNYDNFPDYAYLIALKHYIKEKGAKRFWFYGNFSPLIDKSFYLSHKNLFISYTLKRTKDIPKDLILKIRSAYSLSENDEIVENYFKNLFKYVNGNQN